MTDPDPDLHPGDTITVWYARHDPTTYVEARFIRHLWPGALEVERITPTWPFGGHVNNPDRATITTAQVVPVGAQPGQDLLDLLAAEEPPPTAIP